MSPMLYVLLGLALGLVIGWLLRALRQPAPTDNRLETELRQQLAQRESELAQLRPQLTETSNARAAAEAKQTAAEKLVADQRKLHDQSLREAKQAQDKALADLREAFKALSAEALKQTAPEFLRLANETFGKFQESAKGDLAQRQEAIKTLVKPLKQQLKTYQQRLQQSRDARNPRRWAK